MRWLIIFLCFVANAINFVDRANLAVAIPHIQAELYLSPAVTGFLLSGFFWTYAVMQLPAGWFIDRIGPRIALSVSVVAWSIVTMMTAAAQSLLHLMGCRLMLGVGEAGALPNFAKITALWFSSRERGFASSIFDSGSRFGAALALPLVAWLIDRYGWRMSFLVSGSLGFVWVMVWLSVYRDPDVGKSPPDSSYVPRSITLVPPAAPRAHISWLALFRYRTLWGMMLGFFCLNFTIYFFITWFPAYLMQTRGFSLFKLGTLGVLPAMCAIPGGWLGGIMSDCLYRRGWSLTRARKSCLVGGMLASSVITLSVFATSTWVCLMFFSLAYASLAFTGAIVWTLPAEVAPSQAHVASIAGIQNFAANLGGIVISTFTGLMLSMTHGSFMIPLCVAGALCLLGAFSYLCIVGEIEPLPITPSTANA